MAPCPNDRTDPGGRADLVLGSRLLDSATLAGGMPIWKYISNRFLTITENVVLRQHLSSATPVSSTASGSLETIPFVLNSDKFVFDTEVIAETVAFGFTIAEFPFMCDFAEASSVNFRKQRGLRFRHAIDDGPLPAGSLGIRRSPQFRQNLSSVISRYHATAIFRDGPVNASRRSLPQPGDVDQRPTASRGWSQPPARPRPYPGRTGALRRIDPWLIAAAALGSIPILAIARPRHPAHRRRLRAHPAHAGGQPPAG